jgi:hypothetical protein
MVMRSPSWVPEGYVAVMGPDNIQYVVPEFFTPALQQTLDGLLEKEKLDIRKASGTVSLFLIYTD